MRPRSARIPLDKKASATHFNPRGGIPDHEAYACESVSFSASAELYSSVPGHVHRNQLQTQDVSDGEGPVLLHDIWLAVHSRESGMTSCILQDACPLHVFIHGSGSRIPRPVHHKAFSTKFACPCSRRSLLALNLNSKPRTPLGSTWFGIPRRSSEGQTPGRRRLPGHGRPAVGRGYFKCRGD